jgi:hypothetical protein
MIATPSRRRTIVREQKKPRDFIIARYADVYSTIQQFLLEGGADTSILESAIERLYSISPATEWQEQDNILSAEALESFLDISDSIDLGGWSASLGENDAPQMLVGGVSVSVRPEVLLSRSAPEVEVSGAIKLYISKNSPFTDQAGQYVATTVHQYLTDCLKPAGAPEPKSCLVVDIFGQNTFEAPRSFKRRRNDIEAACEEISRAWIAA